MKALEPETRELLRYLIAHRPSENWAVRLDTRGHILCNRWPYPIPTSIYVKMKEDAELAHDA